MAINVTTCIFDMDGLLLDTERIYTEVLQELLDKYAPGKVFTWDVKTQMMGTRAEEASSIFIKAYDLPMTMSQYLKETTEIQLRKFPEAKVLPGVASLIKHLKDSKIPIAVATSSSRDKYQLKTSRHKELFGFFDHIVCGDDEGVVQGKPAPDIFLVAKRKLGDPPASECLVFEDAILGVEAARNAGMHVCWIPDPRMFELHGKDKEHGATIVLNSMEAFRPQDFGMPALIVA